jgi:hypothetical protein
LASDLQPQSPSTVGNESHEITPIFEAARSRISLTVVFDVGQLEARVKANLAVRELDTSYFLAVGKCSPPPSPAQLVAMAKPYGLTLLPPGA